MENGRRVENHWTHRASDVQLGETEQESRKEWIMRWERKLVMREVQGVVRGVGEESEDVFTGKENRMQE